ncbi:MAG TPA: hypothetical protein VGN69_06970 [Solirubrobacteraceae bacterium]|jgi:hypothetical protein|nr:hypothetical protein [Solirubrobacteraceae bacterium]
MLKRMKMGTGVLAGLAALALGGASLAGATGSPHATSVVRSAAPAEATSLPDTDQVQSGDQSTPDKPGSSAKDSRDSSSSESSSSESNSESGATETPQASDGPGGHADEPGNANANTEQQGQN